MGIRKTPYDAGSEEDDDLIIELPERNNWEVYQPKTKTNVVPMSRALPAAASADKE